MVREMKYREVRKILLANGCTEKDSRGDHVKWYCPCGHHSCPVDTGADVSKGVIRQLIQRFTCLPKGWLQ